MEELKNNEIIEEKNIEKEIVKTETKINVKNELEKINSKTIFEFKKTLDNFELEKVKAYFIKDEDKTVSILFYDNDFFAIDRINFKDGYDYDEKKESLVKSENLNYRIKKIPNVAKTRKILNIEDIETRIYDVSEYIILLKKETLKVLRVNGQDDIEEMKYQKYKLDFPKIEELIEQYETEEEERIKEERSIKNRIRQFTEKAKYIIVEPFKLLRNKLMKTNQIKMLSDGKHSIFDKED